MEWNLGRVTSRDTNGKAHLNKPLNRLLVLETQKMPLMVGCKFTADTPSFTRPNAIRLNYGYFSFPDTICSYKEVTDSETNSSTTPKRLQ